jgi:nucleobase transporter 1/2
MHVAGKIGGFLASIPQVTAAGLLVFMWTMLVALGLSNLRYTETGSSRNVLIVGFSLFLSLSVPAYFRQYTGGSSAGVVGVPSYFRQYTISANGPIHTKYQTVFFPLWTL